MYIYIYIYCMKTCTYERQMSPMQLQEKHDVMQIG